MHESTRHDAGRNVRFDKDVQDTSLSDGAIGRELTAADPIDRVRGIRKTRILQAMIMGGRGRVCGSVRAAWAPTILWRKPKHQPGRAISRPYTLNLKPLTSHPGLRRPWPAPQSKKFEPGVCTR